jgi:ABC-2 type transport system ATP-binding protein
MEEINALQSQSVSKSYGDIQAVQELSFEVRMGEIFGLLGPNGAGKTTCIRMALDIIKPSSGEISVLGGAMTEEKKARIGYLPEERGLYEDLGLQETLIYLGQLKGLSQTDARTKTGEWLKKVELWDSRDKKIKELSRGMRQKAQFAAAVLHKPELIIIDEPFSGLDPVNTRLIKELITELQQAGAAIIMSTHLMHQVEELCGRILLVNKGRQVLYGRVDQIRNEFAGNSVEVALAGDMPDLEGVLSSSRVNGKHRLILADGVEPNQILQDLARRTDLRIDSFERVHTSLDEIFIKVVSQSEAM